LQGLALLVLPDCQRCPLHLPFPWQFAIKDAAAISSASRAETAER
jgi:hypothetical protein